MMALEATMIGADGVHSHRVLMTTEPNLKPVLMLPMFHENICYWKMKPMIELRNPEYCWRPKTLRYDDFAPSCLLETLGLITTSLSTPPNTVTLSMTQ